MNVKKLEEEEAIRNRYNQARGLNAKKAKLCLGKTAVHEFDIFEQGRVIGGITTSPWKNRPTENYPSGSNNSGGQDGTAAELLWLSLWQGYEERVLMLTDKDMATGLLHRWKGCRFPNPIKVVHFDGSKFDDAWLSGKILDTEE
ncbi:MAG: hypothetical protein HY684_01110 [Chloroflexi bacterium]|nr:hypothetical protein [Chloroflexota bacterium]